MIDRDLAIGLAGLKGLGAPSEVYFDIFAQDWLTIVLTLAVLLGS